jgi:hypothetical protein
MNAGTLHVRTVSGRGLAFDVARFDEAWSRIGVSDSSAVEIDLRDVGYMEHETLLFLVSVLSERVRLAHPTFVDLPNDARVLDYLRAWSFPDAVARATGRPFESFLTADSRIRYESVSGSPPRYVAMLAAPGGGREQLLPRSSFALTPISLAENPTDAATVVTSRWLDRHIVSVLDRYLGGFGKRIGTQVIREAVLNAANHPQATVAFTSAQVVKRPDRRKLGVGNQDELEIAIWDDGKTYAETLASALQSERTVRSPAFGIVREKFDITVANQGVTSKIIKLTSDDRSTVANPEHLMVSSFMLGVTSVPRPRPDGGDRGDSYADLGEDILPTAARVHGGLGLYLIRKTVIDQFGGTIRYVSGNFRLRMSLDDAPNHYTGVIQRLGSRACPFRGNLLIVSLPLRNP